MRSLEVKLPDGPGATSGDSGVFPSGLVTATRYFPGRSPLDLGIRYSPLMICVLTCVSVPGVIGTNMIMPCSRFLPLRVTVPEIPQRSESLLQPLTKRSSPNSTNRNGYGYGVVRYNM